MESTNLAKLMSLGSKRRDPVFKTKQNRKLVNLSLACVYTHTHIHTQVCPHTDDVYMRKYYKYFESSLNNLGS